MRCFALFVKRLATICDAIAINIAALAVTVQTMAAAPRFAQSKSKLTTGAPVNLRSVEVLPLRVEQWRVEPSRGASIQHRNTVLAGTPLLCSAR